MIGELWVQYKVVFKNHRMYSSLGYNIPQTLCKKRLTDSQALYTVTSTNAQENWKDILTFDSSTESDFNNIPFVQEISTYQYNNTNWRTQSDWNYVNGFKLKFTFPTTLRGDFEMIITVSGSNLLPSSRATDDATDEFREGVKQLGPDVITPVVTGTALLNVDIPSVQIPRTGNEAAPASQVSQVIILSNELSQFRCHFHLGQAVSSIDNSIEVFWPVFISEASQSDFDAAATTCMEADTYLGQSSLEIRQYNSNQILGSAGQPY
jgi:hypothetical protein